MTKLVANVDPDVQLEITDVLRVMEGDVVSLSKSSLDSIENARKYLDMELENEKTIYGVNTGFGQLANVRLDNKQSDRLQSNLIRSHAIGIGQKMPNRIVRGAAFLLLCSLSRGHSGVRAIVAETIVEFLNKNIIPFVPQIGSLGASGDLAPLAHFALVMIGEGQAEYEGKTAEIQDILSKVNLEPLRLERKEGIALINGTHFMAAYTVENTYRAKKLLNMAIISTSFTCVAIKANADPFSDLIAHAKGQEGHTIVAEKIRKLLMPTCSEQGYKSSSIQDPYSIRCVPQVYGAIHDAIAFLEKNTRIEINAITDNPLIFPDEKQIISAGNFHGEPLALANSYVGIALAELAAITERRIELLVNSGRSKLDAFLIESPGINSGFMIMHYTAAAILTKIRHLAQPTVLQNVDTSAGQEDFNSMGLHQAQQLFEITDQLLSLIVIELIMGCQAIDLCKDKPPEMHQYLKEIKEIIRETFPFLREDKYVQNNLELLIEKIKKNERFTQIIKAL